MDFLELLSELFGRSQKKARNTPTSPRAMGYQSPPSPKSSEVPHTREIDFSKPPLEAYDDKDVRMSDWPDKQMHPTADDAPHEIDMLNRGNKPRYISPAVVAARMKQK